MFHSWINFFIFGHFWIHVCFGETYVTCSDQSHCWALTISMHFCLKDVMPLLIACWPELNPNCNGGGSYLCVLATHRNVYHKTENGSHQFIIQCCAQWNDLLVCTMWCCTVLFSLLASVALMDVDVFNAWAAVALIFWPLSIG